MTSEGRPPVSSSTRNVSVESFPYVVDDRYYLRRMKEILQDGLPKPSLPAQLDQVSGHVFIGNQRNADDATGLRSAGIDHVLSCAASRRSTDSPYDAESGIVDYFLIPAEDREDFDITRFFDAAFLFLDRVKRRRGRALVHCNMGVNRSGAVVAAYLMVDEKKTLLEVISYLKDKRRLVLSNKGFRLQLIQFARSRGLLDPVVDTVTRISYMGDRRRAKSEEDGDKRRKAQDSPSVPTDDRTSFRQLMRDLEHELNPRNEPAVSKREPGTVNIYRKCKENGGVKPRNSNDDLVMNGSVDSSLLRPTGNVSMASAAAAAAAAATKPATADFEITPRKKYSSSVQYWPMIETPRKPKVDDGSPANAERNSAGAAGEQTPGVTKRRRYVRTRSDSRPGAVADHEKPPATATAEPHKLLSTIFCTLRVKPKRNIEIVRQSGVVDGVQDTKIRDQDKPTYHSLEASPKSPPKSSSFSAETSFRPRCLSGTAADRTSGLSPGAPEVPEKAPNGFLVFLGKKVVHAKSTSQWNLSAVDNEMEPFVSTETVRTRIFPGYRRNLNELSAAGVPWRSVEKISESKSIYLIRKDPF